MKDGVNQGTPERLTARLVYSDNRREALTGAARTVVTAKSALRRYEVSNIQCSCAQLKT